MWRRSAPASAPRDDEGLIAALAAVMADDALEPAFVALVLAMPSEADIARDIGRDVDPDAIFVARTRLRAAIGTRLGAALREAYRRMQDDGPYSPDAASAGRRALKNACLDLLAAAGASAIALAARQYHQATNMTDRMAALATLSLHPVPERQAALDDFYRRYSGNPLIIDKWLALQATIPEAATLDRVRALTAHPAFSLANPNRVRALIGGFAQNEPDPVQPRRRRGLRISRRHGARARSRRTRRSPRGSTTAFRSWRALETVRRGRAEAALRRDRCGAKSVARPARHRRSFARSELSGMRGDSRNADGIGGCDVSADLRVTFATRRSVEKIIFY